MLLKVWVRWCIFTQFLNVFKVCVHMNLSWYNGTETIPRCSLPLSKLVLIVLVCLASKYIFEGHNIVLHAMISELLNAISLFHLLLRLILHFNLLVKRHCPFWQSLNRFKWWSLNILVYHWPVQTMAVLRVRVFRYLVQWGANLSHWSQTLRISSILGLISTR